MDARSRFDVEGTHLGMSNSTKPGVNDKLNAMNDADAQLMDYSLLDTGMSRCTGHR